EFLGYETWRYGLSSINIELGTRRVTEWDNLGGNLKVQLQPERQTQGAVAFTRGSHADIVLQVQGTPSSIDTYEFLGYETWRYGLSSINIDLGTRRVTEWDNLGGNLKVK
ncbi:MAG: hypothetical protein OXU68_08740, partial [Bacteroidota bacterium]|nr:hypothetical protein [Bacteroidota bacterium]